MTSHSKRVTLIGAGLAGSLLSVYLAKRGFAVDILERRPDMRKVEISAGRSINLALSTRGIHALHEVGLYDDIMKIAIPMKGRMMHAVSGELTFQRYGRDDSEVIYATSRAYLNIALMNAAERCKVVTLSYEQRCTGMNLETGVLSFVDEQSGRVYERPSAVVIGTDGSASAIRSEMQKSGRFNFSQSYLNYGYKELVIPEGPKGEHRMEKHALHIWPRGTFMLIALPNIDGSFTVTFFYPFEGVESFQTLTTREHVQAFFQKQFPDATSMMPTLVDDFFGNPTGSMVTVKCEPWNASDRALLLGDAAHAIVPFFGQGMNCAFEDCTVLNECLSRYKGTSVPWHQLFREFEDLRKNNCDAIADLAVENFVEMRDLVGNPDFLLKKKAELALQELFPEHFIPKYSMVTFHRIPYSVALSRGITQASILDDLCADIKDVSGIDWTKAERLITNRLTPIRGENL
ncbi:MAG TPA: NAD(P)/FAD-dependent oxidoreductase [Bacteroidota bacterium]